MTNQPTVPQSTEPDSEREVRLVYLLSGDEPRGSKTGLDLAELWGAIWQARLLIVCSTLLLGSLGAVYALMATPWYRADVLLMPAKDTTGQALTSQLAQFAGLASLAGIRVGDSDGAEPLAVLKSKGFARSFIEEQGLVTVLLADKWDPARNRWKESSGLDPDARDAVEYFDKKVRRVTRDRTTRVITLSIEWTDPDVAAAWANLMAERLNEQMRQDALEDAETNIKYLQQEISGTSLVSLQQSVGRLLEVELQKLMLARGNKEFAFHVIDKAQVPKRRFKPRRSLIVLSSVLLGGLLVTVLVVVRHSFQRADLKSGGRQTTV